MNTEYDWNGNCYISVLAGIDSDGNPVKRSKMDYPYSYDFYVTYRDGKNEEANGSVYTDRIWQWDYDKANTLWEKHSQGLSRFNARPHDLSRPDSTLWTNFLREYLELPDLKIIYMMDGCNVSNGFEVGYIAYNSGVNKNLQNAENVV